MSQRSTNAARAHARAAAATRSARQSNAPGGGSGPASDGANAVTGRPSTERPSLLARLRYQFDLTLSRGSGALIGWLAVVTAIFVFVTGLLLHFVARTTGDDATSGDANSIIESSWDALMRTLDPGTVTGDDGWSWRMASLLITVAGIFIFSTLIGLIASVIDRAIEGLRKGRGIVPEQEHTLVLGWSEKLHTIISELRIANSNQRRSCVVVLAPHDRVWMEDEINSRDGGSAALGLVTGRAFRNFLRRLLPGRDGQTRVVCRTGNPADPADLALVAPTDARSIIVLADPESATPDAQVTKVMLGLMSFDRELAGMHVLAEFTDAETASAIKEATGGRVHTVVSNDLIARITAQICRQSGLGAVYQELLDFDGDELYLHDDPAIAGASWGELLLAYPSSSPVGILHAADGRVELNPSAGARISAGDQVIAISEDDDTLILDSIEPWNPPAASDTPAAPAALAPDHLLMVGWNDLAPRMLAHLARAATPGSSIDVVVDPELVSVHVGELPQTGNLEVRLLEGDATRAEPLRVLLDARDYERILLVGYGNLPPAEADARTLLGLVHARRILTDGHRNAGTSIVAELLEPRSVQLGRVANPDDFVVSERLTSLLLAQVSENAALAGVFTELLDGTGVEIVMRPLDGYLPGSPGESTTWRLLVEAARDHGETAIGYVASRSEGLVNRVIVNPAKSQQVLLGDDAELIVLAHM